MLYIFHLFDYIIEAKLRILSCFLDYRQMTTYICMCMDGQASDEPRYSLCLP